jgi:hypothetical protein
VSETATPNVSPGIPPDLVGRVLRMMMSWEGSFPAFIRFRKEDRYIAIRRFKTMPQGEVDQKIGHLTESATRAFARYVKSGHSARPGVEDAAYANIVRIYRNLATGKPPTDRLPFPLPEGALCVEPLRGGECRKP